MKWGFKCSQADSCMMVCVTSITILILLIYVDDIVVTGNNPLLFQKTIVKLNSTFSLKDLVDLSYFLEMEVTRTSDSFYLSQQKYV